MKMLNKIVHFLHIFFSVSSSRKVDDRTYFLFLTEFELILTFFLMQIINFDVSNTIFHI